MRTVQSPLVRLADLGAGAWEWPSWGSVWETRRARRESGRSLKISVAGKEVVRAGRGEFFLVEAVV